MSAKLPPLNCNGCTICCKGDSVQLEPKEEKDFESEPSKVYPGRLQLKRNKQGNCIYLTDTGCSIHDHKPSRCKEFDCRLLWLRMNRRERRAAVSMGHLSTTLLERSKTMAGLAYVELEKGEGDETVS